MKNFSPSLLALSIFFSYSMPQLQAEAKVEASSAPIKANEMTTSLQNAVKSESTPPTPTATPTPKPPPPPSPPPTPKKFEPFTGKIIKNKVRIRLQPTYDGAIVREFNRNDLITVLGETDDFYAIQPSKDFKAFVFRTYVLDNVIEGSRVNVRLKPELDAPVVVQLNSGYRVDGTIYPNNNKWMEIKVPDTTRFYVAKEYVEKAGDAGLKDRLEKKFDQGQQLLRNTDALSKTEMLKPFEQINLEGIKANYQHILSDYPEFPEIGIKAKEGLLTLQEAYTSKKLMYLENKSQLSSTTMEANKKLAAELQAQKSKVSTLEQQIEKTRQLSAMDQPIIEATSSIPRSKPLELPINMTMWIPVEESLFNTWTQQTGKPNPQDYYEEQKSQGQVLRGIVDPYTRPVKNKPGDYMLLSSTSRIPIAYLYSTHINLQDYIGHEVSILVAPRANNNFAFPAYFVLSVE